MWKVIRANNKQQMYCFVECGHYLRLRSQLAFDTPTGSVHVLESGGGPVSAGQLTGGGVL